MSRESVLRVVLTLSLLGTVLTVSNPARALECQESCAPDPTPPGQPPGSCGTSCIPPGHPVVQVTGTAVNARGIPAANAQIYWVYGSVTANGAGQYAITVWADQPVTLFARASWGWGSTTLSHPMSEALTPRSITMFGFVSATVTPEAVTNAPATLKFAVHSNEPVSGTKAWIQLPAGNVITLAFDTSFVNPSGWSRWAGTYQLTANVEGRYTFMACLVDALATGNCSDVAGTRLSHRVTEAYAIDRTPPQIASTTPARFRSVVSASTVSVTWSDSISEIDPASLALWIDGAARSASVAGSTVSTDGSGLESGVHVVRAVGKDIAGNWLNTTFLFTRVTLAASDAAAHLRTQAVTVDPNASTVTFASPTIDMDDYRLKLNATTQIGRVQATRGANFGTVNVEFRRVDGATSLVGAPLASVAAAAEFVVVAPSDAPIEATISQGAVTAAPLTVGIPPGFNVAGTTAILRPDDAPLDPPAFLGDPVQAAQRPQKAAITLSACVTTTGMCSVNARAKKVRVLVAGTWVEAAGPIGNPLGPDSAIWFDPGCRPLNALDTCGQEPQDGSLVAPYACPRAPLLSASGHCGQSNLIEAATIPDNAPVSGGATIGCAGTVLNLDLCTGLPLGADADLAGVYATPFAYSSPGCEVWRNEAGEPADDCYSDLAANSSPSLFAVFTQSHAVPGETACPEGFAGRIGSRLERLIATFAPSASYQTSAVGGTIRVDASGRPSPNGMYWAGVLETSALAIVRAINQHQGPPGATGYASALGSLVTPDGSVVAAPDVASAWWPASPAADSDEDGLQLHAGAQFSSKGATSPLVSIDVTSVFALDYHGGC